MVWFCRKDGCQQIDSTIRFARSVASGCSWSFPTPVGDGCDDMQRCIRNPPEIVKTYHLFYFKNVHTLLDLNVTAVYFFVYHRGSYSEICLYCWVEISLHLAHRTTLMPYINQQLIVQLRSSLCENPLCVCNVTMFTPCIKLCRGQSTLLPTFR